MGIISPGINVSAAGGALGFKDLSNEHIFIDEISYLSSKKIISGFPDGTFKQGNIVTRAQAAIMIGRALELDGESVNSTQFTDVNAKVTGSGYIAAAAKKGIITGFPDGTFKPNDPVTRAQMAIFIDRAFTLTPSQTNIFPDVSPSMTAYQAILNVSANGIAEGYLNGLFGPYQQVTRSQFSAFLARTLEPSFRSNQEQSPKIEKVGEIEAITITQGQKVELPDSVQVIYDNRTTGQAKVTWDTSRLDVNTPGTYTLSGKIEGTELTASVKITIEKTAVTLENVSVVLNEDNSITVNGTVKNGHVVKGQLNQNSLEDIALNEDGTFSYQSGILAEGEHKLTLTAYDEFANPSATIEKIVVIENDEYIDVPPLTNTQELKAYLEENFATLDTIIGTTHFTFNIYENDRIYNAYDYWIQVKYEYEFFGGAMNSIKYTTEQKQTLYNQLKAHQEKLGRSVIAAMPDKKFYGGYYDSWYKYPTLKVDLQTRRYFSWTNYEYIYAVDEYNLTTPSTFRWWDLIDDELMY